MELHQLRYFCAVAREGSFTRAAESLGVAQPSLSQQILKLESEFETKLFERMGRRLRLTPFGAELLPRAQSILKQVADATAALSGLRTGVRGHIRLGAIPTVLPYFIAPRIPLLEKAHPEIELTLSEEKTSRLIELLQEGELDLAIAVLPVSSPDIIMTELFREPILLAVPCSHRLAAAAEATLAEVLTERLLLLKEGHCFRDNVLTACTRAKAQFTSTFESDQFASILALVAAGAGVSLIPQMAASHAPGCCLLPLRTPAVRRIGILRASRHVRTNAEKHFVAWLRAGAKSLSQYPPDR